MIANIFQSVSGLISLYLVSNNLMKDKLFIHMELVVVSCIVSIFFIYNYGTTGVALSYIILYFYTFFRYFFYVNNKIKGVIK
jgi:Na+-driven multidrug efflux pump